MATIDLRPNREDSAPTEEILDENTEVKPPEEGEEAQPDASSASTEAGEDSSEGKVPEEKTDESAVEEVISARQLEADRLLKEIVGLKKERRQVREEPKVFVPAQQTDALQDVNPADVELIEKVMKAKGYVKSDDLSQMTYKEKETAAKDTWLAAHPEYLPENDQDDRNWNALRGVLNSYFKAPANPEEVTKVLDLAHQMLKPQNSLGVRTPAQNNATKDKVTATSKAGAGGGTNKQQSAPSSSTKIDPSMHQHLHGFTDDELKEM